ncbi:hypothetical protein NQ318_017066 [Aromia moschata]|uniref:GH18 domain-containing protein n=1 Tax=Aromia moschata TaxID=1265417 RepID=A0AAV8X4D8_9CUCU|nr:hypothetical protein NQ318_017066 [Aromia moschata]
MCENCVGRRAFKFTLTIKSNFRKIAERADRRFCFVGPTHDRVVVCYMGSWSVYRPNRGSFTIEHLNPNLCTHLIYSFAGLDVKEDAIRSLAVMILFEYSINYMLKLGAPPSKLVMGLPLYGRTFILEEPMTGRRRPMLGGMAKETGFQGPFTRENGFMGYNEICVELKNASSDWKTYWDEESRTPFAVSGNRLIAYDNEQSISEKVQFAMEKGLAVPCSEDGEFVNYPLMRCINKSIVQALKDLENKVVRPEQPDNDKGAGATKAVVASKLR